MHMHAAPGCASLHAGRRRAAHVQAAQSRTEGRESCRSPADGDARAGPDRLRPARAARPDGVRAEVEAGLEDGPNLALTGEHRGRQLRPII